MAELAYFIIAHERNAIDDIVLKGERDFSFLVRELENHSHLLPPSVRYIHHISKNSISHFASESLDVFNGILSEILPAK